MSARVLVARRPEILLAGLFLVAVPWSGSGLGTVEGEASSYAELKLLIMLGVAVGVWFNRTGRDWRVPKGLLVLAAYGGVTSLGAVSGGDDSESLFRSARLVGFCVLVNWLASRMTLRSVVRALVLLAGAVSVVAAVGHQAGMIEWPLGRLGGLLPPLHPNALAGMLGAGVLIATAAWTRFERWRVPAWLVALAGGAALFATGSRNAVAALVAGLFVLALLDRARQRRTRLLVWLISSALLSAVALGATASMWSAVTRNGQSEVDSTFSGRAYAWSSVLAAHSSLEEHLFGQGLAVKRIAVDRDYIEEQTIDGSWHSAYLEAGVGGVILLLAAAALLIRRVRFAVGAERGLMGGLATFVLTQSVLESTLNDVSFAFVLFAALLCVPLAGAEEASVQRRGVTSAGHSS